MFLRSHGEPHDSLGRQDLWIHDPHEVSHRAREPNGAPTHSGYPPKGKDLCSSYDAAFRNLTLSFSASPPGLCRYSLRVFLHSPGEGSQSEPRVRDSGGSAGIPEGAVWPLFWLPVRVEGSGQRGSFAIRVQSGSAVEARCPKASRVAWFAAAGGCATSVGRELLDSRLNPAGMTAGLKARES